MFAVSFTADKITEESGAAGLADSSGYIDPSWSMFKFMHEEDSAIVESFSTREAALEYVENTIGSLESVEERPDGSTILYGSEGQRDEQWNCWTYAGHVEVA